MTTDDITGDALRTRPATDAYRDWYDAIFRKQIEIWPMLDESEWPENEELIDQIGQSGGDGAHYAAGMVRITRRGWCALRGGDGAHYAAVKL